MGTLNLKLANATESAVKPTNAVSPYPAISDENQIRGIIREQFRGHDRRQKQNRRQAERRHHKDSVLLDTRSNRDRRKHGRRHTDNNHQEQINSLLSETKGFDGYAWPQLVSIQFFSA